MRWPLICELVGHNAAAGEGFATASTWRTRVALNNAGLAAMRKAALASRQLALSIDGVRTDVVITVFRDTVLIIVTQRDKIGHLFEGSCDGGDAASDSRTFTVTTLLGSRADTVPQIYARQVVALVTERWSQCRVVFGVALRDATPPVSMLAGVLAALRANALWAARGRELYDIDNGDDESDDAETASLK